MLNTNSMKNITRGGQLILHNARMVSQVLSRITVFCLVCAVIIAAFVISQSTTSYERYLMSKWIYVKIVTLLFSSKPMLAIQNSNGAIIQLSAPSFLQSPILQTALLKGINAIAKGIEFASLISAVLFLVFVSYVGRIGKQQTAVKKIRGDDYLSTNEVNKLTDKSSPSLPYLLGGLTLPKNFETRHLLIHGTTGSGKSVCIRELLDQIRLRNDRVIIYDKGGDYIRNYYRADQDIILNPYDARSASWHLWNECRDMADYESLAAALIPAAAGSADPFWINAARMIFAATARQLSCYEERSMSQLLKLLLHGDLEVLHTFLHNTEAASLVSAKTEKTAISIKSVLATYIKCMQSITDDRNGFCIRNWINDESSNNWLFISSMSDRHEMLKPLISMWMDIAANALMSLAPSPTRRIWLIFDEIASLQQLPYLTQAFAESRKYGGCLVAGMQSMSQLKKIYGVHGADEISGLCNTRVFFRDPSYETAEWASRELGHLEYEETREGYSYSESDMRSGISLSTQLQTKRIINASEIMQLPDLKAYIRLMGNFPITQIQLSYKNRPVLADAFIEKSKK